MNIVQEKRVVISQPMFFPWVGIFEQIRLADTYVHYDDVHLPQGRSLVSRVQIKTARGSEWLTVPIQRAHDMLIRDVRLDGSQPWRERHLKTLRLCYARAPFAAEMLDIVASIYAVKTEHLCELNIVAIETIARYFALQPEFLRSSDFRTTSSGSKKLMDLMALLGGRVYITGHGARHYLDHELFEQNRVRVEYMNYRRTPYLQLNGPFDPHVSILDLIANTGRQGREWIHSPTRYWKEFLGESGG